MCSSAAITVISSHANICSQRPRPHHNPCKDGLGLDCFVFTLTSCSELILCDLLCLNSFSMTQVPPLNPPTSISAALAQAIQVLDTLLWDGVLQRFSEVFTSYGRPHCSTTVLVGVRNLREMYGPGAPMVKCRSRNLKGSFDATSSFVKRRTCCVKAGALVKDRGRDKATSAAQCATQWVRWLYLLCLIHCCCPMCRSMMTWLRMLFFSAANSWPPRG